MLTTVKVSEYAQIKGVTEKTIRNWINKGKLQCKYETIKGRTVAMILIDEKELPDNLSDNSEKLQGELSDTDYRELHDTSEEYHEAELLDESEDKKYSVISMENTTFEELINSIKELANARSEADNKTIESYKEHYLESKNNEQKIQDKIEKLSQQLFEEKLKAAQFESEVKIKSIRIQELDSKISSIEEQNKKLQNDYQVIYTENQNFKEENQKTKNELEKLTILKQKIKILEDENKQLKEIKQKPIEQKSSWIQKL